VRERERVRVREREREKQREREAERGREVTTYTRMYTTMRSLPADHVESRDEKRHCPRGKQWWELQRQQGLRSPSFVGNGHETARVSVRKCVYI
jgi:hypothetical protein